MLELIEKILKVLARSLAKQAAKDSKRIAVAQQAIKELQRGIEQDYLHKAKCGSLSKRILSISEEL